MEWTQQYHYIRLMDTTLYNSHRWNEVASARLIFLKQYYSTIKIIIKTHLLLHRFFFSFFFETHEKQNNNNVNGHLENYVKYLYLLWST